LTDTPSGKGNILTMGKRASGILLHITSLPSKYGIGDFGPQAYKFADFLARAGQSYWQVLPLSPINSKGNYSPYNCTSAFASNTLFISPELLYQQGLLTKKDIQNRPAFPKGQVDYRKANSYKKRLLNTAYEHFKDSRKISDYEQFCLENKGWLEDYATFVALSRHFRPRRWCNWPAGLKNRKKSALKSLRGQLQDAIDLEKFLQFVFFKQWFSLKKYCNHQGVRLIGDIPIYVDYDSADLWTHPEIFKLTKTGKPRFIAGVPPDSFSRTGQLWANPVYDWQVLKNTGYRWWIQRIKHNLSLFDIVRIDHFRGFVSYWQVPASHKTAEKGKWVDGPGEDFFNNLFRHFSPPSFIVEDLGYITVDVRALVKKFQLLGTKVLLFAFDGDPKTNPHYPDNYVEDSAVYTSTHDCNTIRGWFEKEATQEQKKKLFCYLGRKVPVGKVHWELIRSAMDSVCNTVIIPIQDILGLGEQARMNHPATVRGNWRWQLRAGQITPAISKKLVKLSRLYGRV
jgi:4-alpha-glucanotransferase